MEQTTEMVSFGETIDWTYMPAADMEFIFQFNRHRENKIHDHSDLLADRENEPGNMEGDTAQLIPVVSSTQGRSLKPHEAERILLTCNGKHHLIVIAHVKATADCEYIGAMNRYGLGRKIKLSP